MVGTTSLFRSFMPRPSLTLFPAFKANSLCLWTSEFGHSLCGLTLSTKDGSEQVLHHFFECLAYTTW